MYSQNFYNLQTFPHNVAYAQWVADEKYGWCVFGSWAFVVIMHAIIDLAYGRIKHGP
jgi:hypothetical protein